MTVGFDKSFDMKKSMDFIAGFDIINYYTFSQCYNIPATNSDTKFKQSNSQYFGFSFIMNAGLQKDLGKVKIGPTVHLPIFRLWKQDAIFPGEQNSETRNKWLRGIGIGFTCTFSLTKK